MYLYSYLEENIANEYDWEGYNFDETEILEIKENPALLCDIWSLINEWAPAYADNFRDVDAALVVRILNETISFVNSHISKENLSLSDIADICSIYGKCCVFVKNEMSGTELYEKCKFIVNNTIADCIVSKKEPCITYEDVMNCNPFEDCWEEI